MPNRFTLRGGPEMARRIRLLWEKFPHKVGEAILEELDEVKKESQRRTPVRTGLLRSSHNLDPIKYSARKIKGTISVTAPYAVHVHERTYIVHRTGQAKFFESALFERRSTIGGSLARRLDFKSIGLF